ncbi:MAG: hypothetical protein ACKPKO_08140, partial [Candidatus Fonsibacter sp.]
MATRGRPRLAQISVSPISQKLENKYLNNAPRANREKIKNVIQIYKKRNVTINNAEKVVVALYLPSGFGRVGQQGKLGKADEIYEEFLIIYQDTNVEQRERRSGIQMNYHLRMVLWPQAKKHDPDRDPLQL